LRTSVAEIRETGRNAQGVSIMKVAEGERIVAIETFADDGSSADDATAEGADGVDGGEVVEAVDANQPSSTGGDDGSGGADS